MTTISMSDFRRDAEAVLLKVQQGETVVLTDPGKPSVQLTPAAPSEPQQAADSVLTFSDLAQRWDVSNAENRRSLTNEEIDRIVYGI